MSGPTDIVRKFYDHLSAGDVAAALGLMAADIEWITMWSYTVDGRGPQGVADGVFKPLMVEWSRFALVPSGFMADGDTVVSLGDFTGAHRRTGKSVTARYAHVWTVRDGKIASFRQYIDTLALAEARRG